MTKSKKSFYSWKTAGFHLNFPNGNHLSTIWDAGSYTDEWNSEHSESSEWGSDTAEIMFECSEKLRKKILEKYHDGEETPIGRLPLNTWIEIVNLLSKDKKRNPQTVKTNTR